MAVKKNKNNFTFKSVILAAAGGTAAGIGETLLHNNVVQVQENPKLSSLIIAGISAAGLYFTDEEYHPAFYGMIGSSMGELGEELIENTKQKSFQKSISLNGYESVTDEFFEDENEEY